MGAAVFIRIIIVFIVIAAALLASLWVLEAISFESLTDKLVKLTGVGAIAVIASVVISLLGGAGLQQRPPGDPRSR